MAEAAGDRVKLLLLLLPSWVGLVALLAAVEARSSNSVTVVMYTTSFVLIAVATFAPLAWAGIIEPTAASRSAVRCWLPGSLQVLVLGGVPSVHHHWLLFLVGLIIWGSFSGWRAVRIPALRFPAFLAASVALILGLVASPDRLPHWNWVSYYAWGWLAFTGIGYGVLSLAGFAHVAWGSTKDI